MVVEFNIYDLGDIGGSFTAAAGGVRPRVSHRPPHIIIIFFYVRFFFQTLLRDRNY